MQRSCGKNLTAFFHITPCPLLILRGGGKNKTKFAKILVFATINLERRLKVGDRGELGNMTDRLLKLAYGGEDVDQMFRDAERLNALCNKFGVDAQTLEEKISSVHFYIFNLVDRSVN